MHFTAKELSKKIYVHNNAVRTPLRIDRKVELESSKNAWSQSSML